MLRGIRLGIHKHMHNRQHCTTCGAQQCFDQIVPPLGLQATGQAIRGKPTIQAVHSRLPEFADAPVGLRWPEQVRIAFVWRQAFLNA
jgi:hypothetical protein